MGLKTVAYTVRADARQAERWRRAAGAEGHRSVGTWLAAAADAYLQIRRRPVPLAWERGEFWAILDGGGAARVRGTVSPPFGVFRGSGARGHVRAYCRCQTLVYVPTGRIIATLVTVQQCRALAAELAAVWVRWDGSEPAQDAAPTVERHRREAV